MTDFSKRRILIVDDEEAIRSILERLFRTVGFTAECGANGVEGLRRFHQSPSDVVIMDRGMPEMNGEDMATQLKATHPHVPLILITGLPHLVTRPELFFAVVAKPFRPLELVGMVAQATGERCGCEA